MIDSTLAFIYTPDLKKVLLIKKQRFEHHKGLLNGLGGKVEPGETPLDCVCREVAEEAGINLSPSQWKVVGELEWTTWHVTIFAATYKGKLEDIKSMTEEVVAWYDVEALPNTVISNLRWLVPLCINVLTKNPSPYVIATYPE